jgi:hypothetical protein
MNHQKIIKIGISPERVRQLVNELEEQTKEFQMEYHKLQVGHEVLNNE